MASRATTGELISVSRKLRHFIGKGIIICSVEKEKRVRVENAYIGELSSAAYSEKRKSLVLNMSGIQNFQHYSDARGFRIISRENPVLLINKRVSFQTKVLEKGARYFFETVVVVAPFKTEHYDKIIGHLARR